MEEELTHIVRLCDFRNDHRYIVAECLQYLFDLVVQPLHSLHEYMRQISVIVGNQRNSLLLGELELSTQSAYHVIQDVNVLCMSFRFFRCLLGWRVFEYW